MVHSTLTVSTQQRRNGDLTPSLDELRRWLGTTDPGVRTVPIYREIMADTETPVSAYLKIKTNGPAFVLESIEGGERLARYSFIGAAPLMDITLNNGVMTLVDDRSVREIPYEDPLTALEGLLGNYRSDVMPGLPLPRFLGGAVGYLSYEAVQRFEPRVGEAPGRGLDMPESRFMLVDSLLVFDHLERTIKAVSHVHLDRGQPFEQAYLEAAARVDSLVEQLRAPMPVLPKGGPPNDIPAADRCRPNTTPERYREIVERAKEYISAGDIFQVVLAQRVDLPTPAHPFTIYRALRRVNPSPYMFYLDFVDHQIVGASPELLVRLENGVVTNHPIAGTAPRGETPEQDQRLAEELLANEKERAEHVMLVDLGRNDVGRVVKAGTVRIPRFMEIERYSHVMHIVSNVEGDIVDGMCGTDALRACFPAGTVSGAPKVRAMEIIAELETDRRGPYAGAAGYFDFAGGMDTAIALRTLVVKNGVASMQAGGGIVADSTPDGEYAESYHKMRALLRAIELAESLEAAEYAREATAAISGEERP
jgi:anthranilate synthase component 1